ncbi:MAG: helix-turn-helix transcriptional regulator [Geminicoccaceae bacterium]
MQLPGMGSFGNRLRSLRLAKDMSQAELARLIGRHQTAIGPYERDEYMPARDIVAKLADILETSPEYLTFGRSPHRMELQVAGTIEPGAMVNEGIGGRKASLLNLREGQMVLFEVLDNSMAPMFPQGHMIVASIVPDERPEDHLGRYALLSLQDGRTLLRRLLPSRDRDHFDLAALDGTIITGAAVASLRPVLGVLSPEAFTRAENEQ